MFEKSLIIISGSSRGLGKAMALAFLDEGAEVIGISRSKSIEADGYHHLHMDLSDLEAVKALELSNIKGYERYILINNSATLGEVKPFDEVADEAIIEAANLNFIAPMLLISKFNRSLRNEMGKKYVINIGSGAAYQPIDGWSLYCSTKAGLSMLSKVVHLENQIDRSVLKVVDLSPGIIDTEMQTKIRQADSEEFSNVDRFVNYKQKGDLQSPEETARLIISNFESLFDGEDAVDSVRNYKTT